MSEPAYLVLVGGIFFLGGFVKGTIGLGLPTVVIGLLSILMPPAQAAAILVIPAVATNIWQMLAGPAFLELARRMATMMLGVAVGTFATIGLMTGAGPWAVAGLGVVLAIYGVLGFMPRRFHVRPRAEKWASPVVGLVNGAVSGTTGVFVVPGVPYLDALRMEREKLIQAIGIHAFCCPLLLGLALLGRGQLPLASATTGALALLPALAGMYAGQGLRKRLDAGTFRRWFFAGLVVLGSYMFLRTVL